VAGEPRQPGSTQIDAGAQPTAPEDARGVEASPNPEQPATPPTLPPPPPAKPKAVYPPSLSAKSAVYDRAGPAYAILQAPKSAMQSFPADSLGRIDWVEALQRDLIAPRASVSGKGSMKRRFDDIIMRNTREMPWVKFPHAQHTEWLDCSNCHPRPFKEKTGDNAITMDTIMRGQHCGVCHDRVAFSIFACERCHSITHPGSPAAWW
jgi:c(7)-type cytochrome triheme protein